MPAFLIPIVEWLGEFLADSVLPWLFRYLIQPLYQWVLLPSVRFLWIPLWQLLGEPIKWLWNVISNWFSQFLAAKVIQRSVISAIVFAGLGLWAAFLGGFWTWVSGNGLRELFSTNPLTGAPAGVLYLVSYALPLKFMFGISIAYVQWKFSAALAAIHLNRVMKALFGF
ncbi:MAG TPA: hypothetical protein VHG71_06645 [Verrucomicrobiae bacterium]|nr:hypothetical protein [Verrucomicrobiae bacterium]